MAINDIKKMDDFRDLEDTKFGSNVIIGIVVICFLPFLLTLFGVDFGTQGTPVNFEWAINAPNSEVTDSMFHALSGAFTHTILEWTAFTIAIFVVFLALSHYKTTNDITTPILGVAFFMSGCMDAFHTLAADRLIEAVADNTDLIPFTWAICRTFNALIMITGVLLLLNRKTVYKDREGGFRFILIVTAVFGVIAYSIIHYAATTANLPQTTYPDAIITRPYDVLPLILFIIAGLFVYPRFQKSHPSIFAHALVLSALPEAVSQAHMAFGSTALFDSHFNIGHFMKIVAYGIPLLGLTFDYIYTQQHLKREIRVRKKTEMDLKTATARENAILETMVDALINTNDDGIIGKVNMATSRMLGYNPKEMLGQEIQSMIPDMFEEMRDEFLLQQNLSEINPAREPGRELEAIRKNGSSIPINLCVSEFSLENQLYYSFILRDISESKLNAKMKNEFISTVSHELRTPLTSIRGSLGLLVGGAAGELPPAANEMLQIASNNTERLLLLINDILDIQKIESGQMNFHFKNTDAVALVRQTVNDNQSYAQQFGVRFEVHIQQGLEQANVFIDPARIVQVMANLLSNAAKFSPENEIVKVSVARHKNQIRISVTDRGRGIPEDFQPKLFDKFTQFDSSDSRTKGGTGLGLSISKLIMGKHNGHIGCISKETLGSTFFLDFRELSQIELSNSTQEELHLQKDAVEQKPCILIIEDDPEIASILRTILAEEGFDCDIANSFSQAKKFLDQENDYKIITLDIKLPDGSGVDLARELALSEKNKHIPILVISAYVDDAKKEVNGSALGIVEWMQKPIDVNLLQQHIQAVKCLKRKPDILHVEDDHDILAIVRGMINEISNVDEAETLALAKQKLQDNLYDLILLDLQLPDGNGLDLLDVIEALTPQPKVIILSAFDVDESIQDRVNQVLVKSKHGNNRILEVIKSTLSDPT